VSLLGVGKRTGIADLVRFQVVAVEVLKFLKEVAVAIKDA
jgi:hypothetical protein